MRSETSKKRLLISYSEHPISDVTIIESDVEQKTIEFDDLEQFEQQLMQEGREIHSRVTHPEGDRQVTVIYEKDEVV